MTDPREVSLKKLALKTISASVLALVPLLLTHYRLGEADWRTTLARLTPWQLGLLLSCAPLAWLAIEFSDEFFKELAVLARIGGKTAAGAVARTPEAFANVLARAWDRLNAVFTRHSFDGRYRQRLYEDYGLFNDRGLGLINAARLALENVYVELQVGSGQLVPARMELLRHPVNGRQTVWDFLRAVKPWRGLVLIGAPGSGKSTLLQHLLLIFARNRQGRYGYRRLLPILIELRELKSVFQTNDPPTLADAIRSYWRNSSRLSDLMKREPTGWLEHRLRSSRVLLLLDGLDEVPPGFQQAVSAWVEKQMRHEDHRHCLFLVTSRPAGYANSYLPDATVLNRKRSTQPKPTISSRTGISPMRSLRADIARTWLSDVGQHTMQASCAVVFAQTPISMP